jgi:hypothetical protein
MPIKCARSLGEGDKTRCACNKFIFSPWHQVLDLDGGHLAGTFNCWVSSVRLLESYLFRDSTSAPYAETVIRGFKSYTRCRGELEA